MNIINKKRKKKLIRKTTIKQGMKMNENEKKQYVYI